MTAENCGDTQSQWNLSDGVSLAPGEELEYTLIYIVDEDQVDQLYLWFFGGYEGTDSSGNTITSPYVRIR